MVSFSILGLIFVGLAVSMMVLMRLVLLVLRRWLRSKIGQSVIFKSVTGGIEVHGGRFVVPMPKSGVVASISLAWETIKVQWPTWKLPFHLDIVGLRCEVKQVRIPQPVQESAKWSGRNVSQAIKDLETLETLLWTGGVSKRGPSSDPLKNSLSHAILSCVIRNITCSLQLTTVLYIQEGEPGPTISGTLEENQTKDAIEMKMRAIRLGPRGEATSKSSSSLLAVSGVDVSLLSNIPSSLQESHPMAPMERHPPVRRKGKHRASRPTEKMEDQKARKVLENSEHPEWTTSSCVFRQWGLELEVYCLIGGGFSQHLVVIG